MQERLNIGTFPIHIVLCLNATLAFVRVGPFKTIIDNGGDIEATFTPTEFYIGKEKIMYIYETTYPYKQIPEMLSWLKAQNLFMPIEKNIWELNAYP